MGKKTGIRGMLMRYLAVVATLCTAVILFSNFMVSHNLNNSGLFFECNQNLSDFYANVTQMDYYAREYLYKRTEENHSEFVHFLECAQTNLSNIAAATDGDTQWRIGRLENMLDYYCAPLQQYINGEAEAYETYSILYYRKNLITDTATTYYGYLAHYMTVKTNEVQTLWKTQRNLQVFLLVAFTLLGVAMGVVYSKSIYSPIQAMVGNTQRLKKGIYELEPISTNLLELDILVDSFSETAASIERSMDMLKEKSQLEYALLKQENENLAMQNLVTEAKLHSLQTQINPHFLFNTLSMISQSAYISGDAVTSELMDKLSEFLRYALDKADKTSTLYEEIESIKNYLFIQQKRFSGRIEFELDVEPDTPDIHMPAIVLQPLIENAIVHGVNMMTESAVVSLKVHRFQGRVHVHVEDNGVGMDPDKLEALQSNLKKGIRTPSDGKRGGTGLNNVYQRLQMYFGGDMQFGIESDANCGTIVTLTFPTEGDAL